MITRLTCPVEGFRKELMDVADIFVLENRWTQAPHETADLDILLKESVNSGCRTCTAKLSGAFRAVYQNTEQVFSDPIEEKRRHKRQEKLALYHALVLASGRRPPWGSLTGIRPTRLVYEAMARGLPLKEAVRSVRELFSLQADKAALLEDIIGVQQSLSASHADETDIYIGIPFCVSRCRYCSFLSREAGDGKLLVPYVEALEQELSGVIALAQTYDLRVRAVYVGGGTPTALPAALLRRVLAAAEPLIIKAGEVTVEAGRPDTITADKLQVMKDFGATRVCLNPQTMHDRTLQVIGRRHTALQTEDAFSLARKMGFNNINMDLIAGLPGENPDMFGETLLRVLDFYPEALTMHTLCVKRASDMHRYGDSLPDRAAVESMVSQGHQAMAARGYLPYYLYRQKHMAGNLENTGYALPGYACLYNVDMMEDTVTVLAAGAGAMSKRVFPDRKRILRAPNVKDILEYKGRVPEMLKRKKALLEGFGKGVKPASAPGDQPDVLSLELEDDA